MNAARDIDSRSIGDALWRAGRVAWKMDPHQREVYSLFLAWDRYRQTPEYAELVRATGASLDDVFAEELARRFGKTSKWILALTGIAQQRPGAVLTYGTAFAKDIGEIIVPLAEQLLSDAPNDVRPRYRRSMGASHEGLYYPNGSVVRLVGVDVNPNGLRGRYSDGVVLSECGFMRNLENLVRAVLLPQFQRRPWAFLALETSTPEAHDHDFTRVFVPDCQARKAYVKRTLDDNHVMSAEDKEKYIRQAGGRGHPTCEREYYCVVSRDPESTVVPEFDRKRHVVPRRPSPKHAHCYSAADPAIRDLFALGFGYWDVERQKLVIQRSWAERNAGTKHVASVIRATEAELWSETTAWSHDQKTLMPQPHARTSDTDLRLIYDLSNDYGIYFVPTLKDDKDAQIYALRDAFLNDLIEIEEDGGPLADHVEAARWDNKRKDFERTPIHGHFDCLDMLIYLWRYVSGMRNLNPLPPKSHGADYFERPKHEPTLQERLMPHWRR